MPLSISDMSKVFNYFRKLPNIIDRHYGTWDVLKAAFSWIM